mmetsp:Transcript_10681/g.16039  ORF Transcript_10681/g.16039 Transcript_10681/m.16039 type:complete len:1127 (-) Transcript_10681:12-3392(-)
MRHLKSLILCSLLAIDTDTDAANWAQLAGERAQNIAIPYVPQNIFFNASGVSHPMWSARWGHAVVVFNQTIPRNDYTEEENSKLINEGMPKLVLLGGDDLVQRTLQGGVKASAGQFRNDIWWTEPPLGTQLQWKMEEAHSGLGYPMAKSQMKWNQSNKGRVSPPKWPSGPKISEDMTYMDWIKCQDVNLQTLPDPSICDEPAPICYDDITEEGCHPEAVWKRDNMWSPRRGHAAVVANDKIFVIGGRGSENMRMRETSMVGGILGYKAEDTRDHATNHAEVVLKNDVWVSEDGLGKHWKLVNPGCQDHQEDVLLQTEVWTSNQPNLSSPHTGIIGAKCSTSSDCYGSAECRYVSTNTSGKVCVCPMFSPREHHTVTVQHRYVALGEKSIHREDYIYIVGGFTNVRQSFCADRPCGSLGSYKQALDDAWVSNDGVHWVQLAPAFSSTEFQARGAHASLLIHDYTPDKIGHDRLWIFGGETAAPNVEETHYFNDTWYIDLPSDPCCMYHNNCGSITQPLQKYDIGVCLPSSSDWNQLSSSNWTGRSGHSVVYEPALSRNNFKQQMYLIGGRNGDTVLSDVWTWDLQRETSWRKDFDPNQWYKANNNGKLYFGPSSQDQPFSLDETPHRSYLTGDSPISELKETFLPVTPTGEELKNSTLPTKISLLSEEDAQILHSNGIVNIDDLANANLQTILKFRGFDFPGEKAKAIPRICEAFVLANALLDQCTLQNNNRALTRGKSQSVRKTKPIDHSFSATSMVFGETYFSTEDAECNDLDCRINKWDGCTPIGDQVAVDVNGIGDVLVPQTTFDPTNHIKDLNCRQKPKGRYSFGAALLDNHVLVVGGQGSDQSELHRDVWARDDSFPQATISTRPRSGTHDSEFTFESNEGGAEHFEYKIMDAEERLDVTPWIKASPNDKTDVSWLDNKKGGPGEGTYALFVRSIDPSGNKDYRYSTSTNVHVWRYVPSLPWRLIISCTCSGIAVCVLLHFEYRRRKRKAALERYAVRRMRRKFKSKALSRGLGEITDEDWKALYRENKVIEKEKRKSRKIVPVNDEDQSITKSPGSKRMSESIRSKRDDSTEERSRRSSSRRKRRERRSSSIHKDQSGSPGRRRHRNFKDKYKDKVKKDR